MRELVGSVDFDVGVYKPIVAEIYEFERHDS
jgi:hypothetical protein